MGYRSEREEERTKAAQELAKAVLLREDPVAPEFPQTLPDNLFRLLLKEPPPKKLRIPMDLLPLPHMEEETLKEVGIEILPLGAEKCMVIHDPLIIEAFIHIARELETMELAGKAMELLFGTNKGTADILAFTEGYEEDVLGRIVVPAAVVEQCGFDLRIWRNMSDVEVLTDTDGQEKFVLSVKLSKELLNCVEELGSQEARNALIARGRAALVPQAKSEEPVVSDAEPQTAAVISLSDEKARAARARLAKERAEREKGEGGSIKR